MDFPGFNWQAQVWTGVGALTSISAGTTLSITVANTKGPFSVLTTSTPRNAGAILVFFGDRASAASKGLVDVAIGAPGAEQIILPNLHVSQGANEAPKYSYFFTLPIPANTQLSARWQSNSTLSPSTPITVALLSYPLISGPPCGEVDVYGLSASSASATTTIDPGGTANTKGLWTTVAASSLTNSMCYFTVAFDNLANSARTLADWLLDIAIGPSGSEQTIVSNFPLSAADISDFISPYTQLFGLAVPRGTRISMRSQCSIIDATDRLFGVAIYGVR